ncbi:CheY-like protein [Coemansia reversa NRRL 1564]|uniref:CheY-like protein n=1 Tax=Coemansia reversa (strain ATCC 12441 / NRRL 1564) TaxID=763665 RepID=A0A2G5B3R4_COERN|nr:CheY-like protein [Coemansia reversa NRRL 1564]|eukprot:PIA13659.1 CheY-like protein [Coemansia reversa NRRL 1564]
MSDSTPPIRVLLVEDNLINRSIMERFLRHMNVRYDVASNGEEAIRIVAPAAVGRGPYHIVFMDIQMPIMDGIAATKHIRRLELSVKSPVIIVALTASSLESDRRAALSAGCNDFLTKPVSLIWLKLKIVEWGCMQALIDHDGWRKWRSKRSRFEVPQ